MYIISFCIIPISLGVKKSERETEQPLPSNGEFGMRDVLLLRFMARFLGRGVTLTYFGAVTLYSTSKAFILSRLNLKSCHLWLRLR
jgi:hypothetical protein